jgi:hypothetical protein
MVDRFLATLPYPEEEFDRENPFWPPWRRTPWVGTRHRMDALYGRDFNVTNLSSKMLDYIDDHFGPLSIETVSQAIHFARLRAITTRQGFNDFVRPDRLRERLPFPIMHVHGRDNGLASNRTPEHFRRLLTHTDTRFESDRAFLPRLYEAGHQDLLIGVPAAAMLQDMNAYLETPFPPVVENPADMRNRFVARIPAFGVRAPLPFAGSERCSLADEGPSGAPVAALLIPVDAMGQPAAPEHLRDQVEWRALQPVSPREPSTRYTFDLAGYAAPDGAFGLLVLVLYSQSAAIQPGINHSNSELAARIARRTPGGAGLADLAGAVLAASGDAENSMATTAQEMAQSIQHTLESAGSVDLSLGILHPPRRPASSPESRTRSFAVASCQYPGGILDRTPPGTPTDSPAGPSDGSYLRLQALLAGTRGAEEGKPPLDIPEFLVLAGDQIYADTTAGLFDPRRLDDRYRGSYEAFFGARGARSVLSRLPAVMRLDDHEIDDNWEPDPSGASATSETERLKHKGLGEFLRNQCDQDYDATVPVKLWDQTPVSGFPFFWADARTARTPRTARTVGSANMLGAEQTQALERWLADKSVPGPRFVVSASMVLPRHLQMQGASTATALLSRHLQMQGASTATALLSDSWDGYPASLHHVLARIHERGLNDVVFLSGDAHVSNVARIEIRREDAPGVVVAHSIHSSALYAPYPFANGIEEDFATDEEFQFKHDELSYRCSVKTWFPSRGDGFAVVSVSAEAAAWLVNVRFDRAKGSPYDPANRFEFRVSAAAAPASASSLSKGDTVDA